MILLTVLLAIAIFNIPFGYWRAATRKFSLPWVLAIHLPVPAIVALRLFSGIDWSPYTFPLPILAFFLGQYSGARLHEWMESRSAHSTSGCLVMDAYRRMKK
ncbi:MAG: hypothetical protein RBU27_05015 [Bacteroidota bacterium]|jgi:hypothetical protein|nr:hypothetical protein [Bacteroidota bacterium]